MIFIFTEELEKKLLSLITFTTRNMKCQDLMIVVFNPVMIIVGFVAFEWCGFFRSREKGHRLKTTLLHIYKFYP